jgi:hypothetical protein
MSAIETDTPKGNDLMNANNNADKNRAWDSIDAEAFRHSMAIRRANQTRCKIQFRRIDSKNRVMPRKAV